MPDYGIKTNITAGGIDARWLRSRHGEDNTIPATIDRTLLAAGTHYDEHGHIPSGLPLGKVTTTGLYGPYDPEATDGRAVLGGFSLTDLQLEADFGGVTTQELQSALLVHGIIRPEYVPTTPVLTTGIKTTGNFVFVGSEYVAPGAAASSPQVAALAAVSVANASTAAGETPTKAEHDALAALANANKAAINSIITALKA